MKRILAIDFGEKRCGIAVTDPLQLIASGLTTVATTELLAFLQSYTQDEKLEKIIIGQPKHLNNQIATVESVIQKYIQKIKQQHPEIELLRVDERFTSKMAIQAMIQSGLKKKTRQNKALIDEVSATIILQSYLAQNTI